MGCSSKGLPGFCMYYARKKIVEADARHRPAGMAALCGTMQASPPIKKWITFPCIPFEWKNIKSFFACFLFKESRSSLLLFGQRSLAGGADGFAVQLYRAGGYLAAQDAGIGGAVLAQQDGIALGHDLQRRIGGDLKGAA